MNSKTDSVVKLVIVFFIALLSFSVGTFVGKKYSDNQHQLAVLEPQKKGHDADRHVASEAGHEGEHKEGALSDEEISKLAEEFVADDVAPTANAEHGEAKHGEHSEKVAEGEHEAPKAKVEKEVVAAHKHQEPLEIAKKESTPKVNNNKEISPEDRAPSSLPKDVAQYTVGKFTVQVASYADEQEAKNLATSLKGKGFSAFYVPANIKGKTWFRVGIGQFATQKEAIAYRTEFMNTSKITTAIVQKITE